MESVVKRRFVRALVTGASAGIGAEMARELARRGTSLVLVARSEDRLQRLAEEIDTREGASTDTTEVLVADLLDPADLRKVEQRLRDRDDPVDLLVNNAGVGQVGRFDELDVDGAQRQVELNVLAPVRLTHAALPLLEEVRGGLLNVSSIGGNQPVPRMATYAGTKAFLTSWTEALHEELRGTGVHVTALTPGFTQTEFADRADAGGVAGRIPSFVWSDPRAVARAGLDGVMRGRAVVTPGPLYRVGTLVAATVPSAVSRRAIDTVVRTLGN